MQLAAAVVFAAGRIWVKAREPCRDGSRDIPLSRAQPAHAVELDMQHEVRVVVLVQGIDDPAFADGVLPLIGDDPGEHHRRLHVDALAFATQHEVGLVGAVRELRMNVKSIAEAGEQAMEIQLPPGRKVSAGALVAKPAPEVGRMVGRVIRKPHLECLAQPLPRGPGDTVEKLEPVLGVRGMRVVRTVDRVE